MTGLDYCKLTRLCGACPFATDDRFAGLGVDRRQQIADSLRRGEPFSCHKTLEYDSGDPHAGDRARLCAGARATLEVAGEPEPQILQVARRLGVDVPDLADGLPVHESLDEWVDAGARWSR